MSSTDDLIKAIQAKQAAQASASNGGGGGGGITAAMANMLQNGVPGTSSSNEPNILLARGTRTRAPGYVDDVTGAARGSREVVKGAKSLPMSDAKLEIYRNDSLRQQWANALVAAGLLSPGDVGDIGKVTDAWDQMVTQAGKFSAAGSPKTPFDILKMYHLQNKVATPTTTTSDTSQTTNYSQSDVEGKLKGVAGSTEGILQRMLGRNPTPHEVAAYQAGLNTVSAQNPTNMHSTTTTDSHGNSNTQQTVSGGIDANQTLADMAEQDPEYGAYQASTFYMNALRNALGGYV